MIDYDRMTNETPIIIIKAGNTYKNTREALGDFEEWICEGMGVKNHDIRILDMEGPGVLPDMIDAEPQGVIVAGSHAMVTDRPGWMQQLCLWIKKLVEKSVPFLGICFGHQVLAHAMGGMVDFHSGGRKIGTVNIRLSPEAADDRLFGFLPETFFVHVTHAQSVLSLPAGAIPLAFDRFENNYVFRLGTQAWGVQFHPEFNVPIMESYISEQASELVAAGQDVSTIRAGVRDTPEAKRLLKLFARLVLDG